MMHIYQSSVALLDPWDSCDNSKLRLRLENVFPFKQEW